MAQRASGPPPAGEAMMALPAPPDLTAQALPQPARVPSSSSSSSEEEGDEEAGEELLPPDQEWFVQPGGTRIHLVEETTECGLKPLCRRTPFDRPPVDTGYGSSYASLPQIICPVCTSKWRS
jgi:hypothetical protein